MIKFNTILLLTVILFTNCKQNETRDLNHNAMNPSDKNIRPDSLFNNYDIKQLQQFGSLHPDAPHETKQFDFMIGNFVCHDSLLTPNGWKQSKATWETHYILNGYGIRDVYRNESYAGESIRFYNTSKNKWDVYFYGMPGEHTGLWEGEYIDGKMVMQQSRKGANGENLMSQLTFYNITDNSFDWKGELKNLDNNTTKVNWKIKAERKL